MKEKLRKMITRFDVGEAVLRFVPRQVGICGRQVLQKFWKLLQRNDLMHQNA